MVEVNFSDAVQPTGSPVDGFLKKRIPAPSLLTGVFSGPLDGVAARRAPGPGEAARLVALIRALEAHAHDGLEGVPQQEEWAGAVTTDEVLSDAELDLRLLQYLAVERPAPTDGRPGLEGLEGVGDVEDAMERLVDDASPEQLEVVDAWLREWAVSRSA